MVHDDTQTELKARLAENLRRLRVAGHLSQSQLARATSMSKATLSGIERGRGNPTLDTLATLAEALGASVADLLEQPHLGEVRIVRASQTDPPPAGALGNRPLENSTNDSGNVETHELIIPPNHTQKNNPLAPGSRRAVYVLQGTLIVGPVERISELTVGDYASFPADVAHVYETGRGLARVLVVTRLSVATTTFSPS